MANAIYPKAREAFATALIDWLGDDISLVVVDVGYVYDDAHEFLDDVTGTAIVETSGFLTGKDATDGILDADDVTLTAVTGDDITGVIVYQDTGSGATSRLIVFYDTLASAALIDTTPDGGNIVVRWSDGTYKMFRL